MSNSYSITKFHKADSKVNTCMEDIMHKFVRKMDLPGLSYTALAGVSLPVMCVCLSCVCISGGDKRHVLANS